MKRYDICEAIEEYEAKKPTESTCKTLAALYIIRDNLGKELESEKKQTHKPAISSYSLSDSPVIQAGNDSSEFLKIATSKDISAVLNVIDELVTSINMMNPRLYAAVISKLRNL